MTTLRFISRGTYGAVFECQDVAIKFYFNDFIQPYSSQLLNETDVLFRLSHPNLVNGIDFYTKDSHPELFKVYQEKVANSRAIPGKNSNMAISQPLMDGTLVMLSHHVNPLKQTFQGREMVSKICQKMIAQISSAASYLYTQGYLHLDIKPSNILYKLKNKLSSEDDVDFYLADFGSCLKIDAHPTVRETNVTRIGTFCFLHPQILIDYKRDSEVYLKDHHATYMIGLCALEFIHGLQYFHSIFGGSYNNLELLTRTFTNPKFKTYCDNALDRTDSEELKSCITRQLFENIPLEKSNSKTYPSRKIPEETSLLSLETLLHNVLLQKGRKLSAICLTIEWVCYLFLEKKMTRINISALLDLTECFYETRSETPNYNFTEAVKNYLPILKEKIGFNPLYHLETNVIHQLFDMIETDIAEFIKHYQNCYEEFRTPFERLESPLY